MPARRLRTPVVLDTNVFVRSFKTRAKTSPNGRIVRLWLLERRLQLVVCDEVVEEYLGVFGDVLLMDQEMLTAWHWRFTADRRTTVVRLGRRYGESRDPDDNLFLSTARSGRAEYLITNDRDLLDLPGYFRRTLPFALVTPREFLDRWSPE